MKIKKSIYIIIGIIIAIVTISGFRVDKYYHSKIYDNNSKIAEVQDNCVIKSLSGNFQNNNYSAEFDEFNGKNTILIVFADEKSEIEIDYKNSVNKGKLKAVLVFKDKNVTNICEQNNKDRCTIEVPKGKNRIKLVGASATGKININFKENKNVRVYVPDDNEKSDL